MNGHMSDSIPYPQFERGPATSKILRLARVNNRGESTEKAMLIDEGTEQVGSEHGWRQSVTARSSMQVTNDLLEQIDPRLVRRQEEIALDLLTEYASKGSNPATIAAYEGRTERKVATAGTAGVRGDLGTLTEPFKATKPVHNR